MTIDNQIHKNPQIYALMSKTMEELEPVAKDKKNQAQGYKFRSVDDVYAAVKKALVANNLFFTPLVIEYQITDREFKSGTSATSIVAKVEYNFYAPDGSSVSTVVLGEGMDTGDKAANKAMTSAVKNALIQVFCITTGEDSDSEHESYESSRPANTRSVSPNNTTSASTYKTNTPDKPIVAGAACPHCTKQALEASKVNAGTYWCNKNLGGCGVKGIVLSETK